MVKSSHRHHRHPRHRHHRRRPRRHHHHHHSSRQAHRWNNDAPNSIKQYQTVSHSIK